MNARLPITFAMLALTVAAAVASCSGSNDEAAPPVSGPDGSSVADVATAACPPSQTLCNALCVDVTRDTLNCGSCGTACRTGEVCTNGTCGVVCTVGTDKCGNACVDTSKDRDHCGNCDTACQGADLCSKGTCSLACGGGTTRCTDVCADTKSDPTHCGNCTTQCAAGQVCSFGACALTCGGGTKKCGSACVDTNADPSNCGDCDVQCAPGLRCSNGTCAVSCQVGLTECGGSGPDAGVDASVVPGLCVDLVSNHSNCSACGASCTPTQDCSAQHCCAAGLSWCGASCILTANDPLNCGGCGTHCTGGTPLCVARACAATCPAGYDVSGTRCKKVYKILAGDLVGLGSPFCATLSDGAANSDKVSVGGDTYGFQWTDTGAADGFTGVSRIDIEFFDGASSLSTATIQTVALNAVPAGSYLEHAGAGLGGCPAVGEAVTLANLGAAPRAAYALGANNQFLIHASPGGGGILFAIAGLSANPTWGAGVYAQVTVTY